MVDATAIPSSARRNVIAIVSDEQHANDCVVFPQFVEAGHGNMILPFGEANNGLVTLGSRRTFPAEVVKGISLPCVAHADARPTLTSGDAGYVMYDLQASRLIYWNGSQWYEVSHE